VREITHPTPAVAMTLRDKYFGIGWHGGLLLDVAGWR